MWTKGEGRYRKICTRVNISVWCFDVTSWLHCPVKSVFSSPPSSRSTHISSVNVLVDIFTILSQNGGLDTYSLRIFRVRCPSLWVLRVGALVSCCWLIVVCPRLSVLKQERVLVLADHRRENRAWFSVHRWCEHVMITAPFVRPLSLSDLIFCGNKQIFHLSFLLESNKAVPIPKLSAENFGLFVSSSGLWDLKQVEHGDHLFLAKYRGPQHGGDPSRAEPRRRAAFDGSSLNTCTQVHSL